MATPELERDTYDERTRGEDASYAMFWPSVCDSSMGDFSSTGETVNELDPS